MLLFLDGGDIASGSTNQHLNTRSSTEAELVATDDFLSNFLWKLKFLKMQGYLMDMHLYQDNKLAMILETKGRSSLGKRSRAISIHYFAIKDSVDKGVIKTLHCPTEKMLGEYFTKPLQGSKFLKFIRSIVGAE